MSSVVAAAIKTKLAKAEEYLLVADLANDECFDASVSLSVSASINAADVLCLAKTGSFPSGPDHGNAATILKRVGLRNESLQLARVLGLKTKAQYSASTCSRADAHDCLKSAERLLQSAKREAEAYSND